VDEQSDADSDPDPDTSARKSSPVQSRGRILISLFEGEPYTLWNVRDLARHCGLRVVTSMRFPWWKFPGYKHARTIGNIRKKGKGIGKGGGMGDGDRGGWKGEEREGRWFVFEMDDGDTAANADGSRRKKRTKGDGVSDSDEDS
jgi:25S rRNA (uracil2634-N3)-methyltransferase